MSTCGARCRTGCRPHRCWDRTLNPSLPAPRTTAASACVRLVRGTGRNSVERPRQTRHDGGMGMLDVVAGRVAGGATVEFKPSGSSMLPLIRSRQSVVVAPADPAKLEFGDIVLARVAGTVYLHLVPSLDPTRNRVQISNNRGRVNGWTSHDRVFGICVGRPPGSGHRVSCGYGYQCSTMSGVG